LGLGESAERIATLYQMQGPKVFEKRSRAATGLLTRVLAWTWDGMTSQVGGVRGAGLRLTAPVCRWLFNSVFARYGLDFGSLLGTRYDGRELERALREILGNRTLEAARTRVIVPAVDLTCGKPVVFKSPHLADACSRDKAFSAVQIAMATAAAPTYFPHVSIRDGSAYCDGGLWANNPLLLALAEAQRLFRSAEPGTPVVGMTLDDIEVLSVGTGRGRYSLVPPDADAGLLWWGPRVLDVMSLSQAAGTDSTARFLLGDRLHRVDFDLPDQSWKLDSVEHASQLVHLGREAAHAHLAELRPVFFSTMRPAALEKRGYQPVVAHSPLGLPATLPAPA